MSRSKTLIPCSPLTFLVAVHRGHDGRVKLRVVNLEKIGIFQDVTVIRHDKKIDLPVTPVEARMRA